MNLKQQGFIRKFIETGNGAESAAQIYDVKNRNVAAATASRLLRNVNVQQAIRRSLEATGLTPESISEYLKKAIVSGLGQRATNSDSLRGIDIYARLTGGYEPVVIEQTYKMKLEKMNSKELKIELEKTQKLSSELLKDLNF